MATADASTCGAKRKEVVVSFMTTDSPHDASESTKMKVLLTTSMSSSRGEVISFLDYEEKTEFMTLKPREISKILEPEKKYLCLQYGPNKKPKFIFLDFTDESREKLEEWHDFLCRMMGLVSSPQRRYTGNAQTLQKPKSHSKPRIVSAIQPSITPILNGDSTSDLSSLGSLKSTGILTDEWQEAIRRCTGQPYDPNPVLRRVRSANRWRRRAIILSTLPASGDELADSDYEQVEASSETSQEAPLEAHQEAPPALLVAPQEARSASHVAPPEGPSPLPARPVAPLFPPGSQTEDRVLSETSETSGNDSRPDSLRSRDADLSPKLADLTKNSVEKEFNLSDLKKLKFMDYKGDVIVKEASPLCQLHVGDKIVLRNARGLPMNAQELIEHIRPSIVLTIVRGAVSTARKEGHEPTINIKGSQIAKSMREAPESSREDLTLRHVPQSLLDDMPE